jgi:hypothetical protein
MERMPRYWVTPVNRDEYDDAVGRVRALVGERRLYVLGNRTHGRRHVRAGDWLCFYVSGTGVIAHAQVEADPQVSPDPNITRRGRFPWVVRLMPALFYFESPVAVDANLRTRLDAFRGRDEKRFWGWFVMSTREVSESDFRLLTDAGEKG